MERHESDHTADTNKREEVLQLWEKLSDADKAWFENATAKGSGLPAADTFKKTSSGVQDDGQGVQGLRYYKDIEAAKNNVKNLDSRRDEYHEKRLDRDISYNARMEDELAKRKTLQRKEFDTKAKELATEKEKLKAAEIDLRVAHRELQMSLDLDSMKNNPFLSQFVAEREEIDKFVKDTPKEGE